MELSKRWQRIFADLAKTIAKASKDPSTKVGCVIYRPDKSVASMGFNGFPPGYDDSPEFYEDREYKLKCIKHAEINALDFLNGEDSFNNRGLGMVCTFLPCKDCANEIIEFCDIKIIYYLKASDEAEQRWADSFKASREAFAAAGIKVVAIDEQDINEL